MKARLGYGLPNSVLDAPDPKAQRAVSDFDMTHPDQRRLGRGASLRQGQEVYG